MTAKLRGLTFIFDVGGFSVRQHYPMMISVEMQQRLCTRFKKSAVKLLLRASF
jgi:hypothetical protein